MKKIEKEVIKNILQNKASLLCKIQTCYKKFNFAFVLCFF